MVSEYKLVVLGGGGVGKSAITVQFINGIFVEKYDPTIEDSYRKYCEDDVEKYLLEIYDTSYCESFSPIHQQIMKESDGFILVYSVKASNTLDGIDKYFEYISSAREPGVFPMILVGNKIDLQDERKVTIEQGQTVARRLGCPHLETSAKSRVNINEVFQNLIRLIRQMNPEKSFVREQTKGVKQNRCIMM